MKTIAFMAPLTLGKGQRAVTLHHEFIDLPDVNADELLAKHRGTVIEIKPGPVAAVYGVAPHLRFSPLHMVDCPTCGGLKRMTVCAACNGAARLMAL